MSDSKNRATGLSDKDVLESKKNTERTLLYTKQKTIF